MRDDGLDVLAKHEPHPRSCPIHPCRRCSRNATSAGYLPAEQLLARLEALTGVGSACQQEYKSLYE